MFRTKIAMARMRDGDFVKSVTDAFDKILSGLPDNAEVVNHSISNISSASEMPNLMIVVVYKVGEK